MSAAAHVYQMFLKAEPARVWQAIIDPDFTRTYFHGTRFVSTLEPGSEYRYATDDGTNDAATGTVELVDPGRKLVMTWRSLYDPALSAEPPSRVEWEIEPAGDGLTRLRVVHGDLGRSPNTWASVKDGWVWILNAMKTVLETGEELPNWNRPTGPAPAGEEVVGEWHRTLGIEANNSVFEMFSADRTPDNDEEMLRRAYASAYHWQRAARRTPANEARALYMLAKAQWYAGDSAAAGRYADRCLAAVMAAGDACADFDLAYAYEVQARAAALRGDEAQSQDWWRKAKAVPIADAEDRAIVDEDFADAPDLV